MNLRKATHLVSSLLLAVGLGVFSDLAEAQNSRAKKPSASARRSGTHSKKSSKRYELRERGQKAPTPDRISEIQQALAKDGSYTGNPNGKWDDSTVEAMKKFQEAHGLNPTGKLDARSLQQLGLGSAIAGVARPLPSNTTSKLTPPSTQAGQHRH